MLFKIVSDIMHITEQTGGRAYGEGWRLGIYFTFT